MNVGKSSFVNALLHVMHDVPRAPPRAKPFAVYMDKLPAGYRLGDVYTGDLSALAKRVGKDEKGVAVGEGAAAVPVAPVDGGLRVAALELPTDAPGAPQFLLTTSPMPGTTLGVVGAPLVGGGMVYDMPGLILNPRKQALLERIGEEGGTAAFKHVIPATAFEVCVCVCVCVRASARPRVAHDAACSTSRTA